MNKKGNYPDISEYIHVAIVLAMVITITVLVISNWNTGIQAMNESVIPAQAKVGIAQLNTALPGGLDFLFLSILLIFVGFSVAMARLIPSTPKFIFISIMTLILLPFASMFVVNVWNGFYQQPTITAALSNFTFLPFIMDKLVIIVVLYSSMVMISLLTKNE